MTITYKGSLMKNFKLALIISAMAVTVLTQAKHVSPEETAVVAILDQETHAVQLFKEHVAAGASSLKVALEKAKLFQFATLVEKLQNLSTRFQAAKTIPAKYPKLAAALKAEFGDSLAKVNAFLKK